MGYHVKAVHMGYHASVCLHVSVCLPVALFLVYMFTRGASPRYHGASPITNAVFTLMRCFLVYMVNHGASPRYHGARSDYKCSIYIDASLSGLHGYSWR